MKLHFKYRTNEVLNRVSFLKHESVYNSGDPYQTKFDTINFGSADEFSDTIIVIILEDVYVIEHIKKFSSFYSNEFRTDNLDVLINELLKYFKKEVRLQKLKTIL